MYFEHPHLEVSGDLAGTIAELPFNIVTDLPPKRGRGTAPAPAADVAPNSSAIAYSGQTPNFELRPYGRGECGEYHKSVCIDPPTLRSCIQHLFLLRQRHSVI
jgi:hypothetical protein